MGEAAVVLLSFCSNYFLVSAIVFFVGTVTRHSQVTIPKEIREAAGIVEGDRVKMKVVEGDKIMIEKTDKEVWRDCTGFLPEDFERVLASIRSDSRTRFKRLGLIP